MSGQGQRSNDLFMRAVVWGRLLGLPHAQCLSAGHRGFLIRRENMSVESKLSSGLYVCGRWVSGRLPGFPHAQSLSAVIGVLWLGGENVCRKQVFK